MNRSIKINGLVISAGFSSRMKELKPLMDFEGKPFLAGIILKLSTICDSIVVVTGFESQKINEETNNYLDEQGNSVKTKVNWCFNADYENGMFSSLQAGLRDLKDSEWILYHFVDQPGLPLDFYLDFQKQIDNKYDWIQPTYITKNGHPLLFSRKMIKIILNAESTQSLRDLKDYVDIQKNYWSCNYPQVLQDLDSKEELSNETKKTGQIKN